MGDPKAPFRKLRPPALSRMNAAPAAPSDILGWRWPPEIVHRGQLFGSHFIVRHKSSLPLFLLTAPRGPTVARAGSSGFIASPLSTRNPCWPGNPSRNFFGPPLWGLQDHPRQVLQMLSSDIPPLPVPARRQTYPNASKPSFMGSWTNVR